MHVSSLNAPLNSWSPAGSTNTSTYLTASFSRWTWSRPVWPQYSYAAVHAIRYIDLQSLIDRHVRQMNETLNDACYNEKTWPKHFSSFTLTTDPIHNHFSIMNGETHESPQSTYCRMPLASKQNLVDHVGRQTVFKSKRTASVANKPGT